MREFTLLSIYTLLFYMALPFIYLRLWWRGKRDPRYRKRWGERLGFLPRPIKANETIWFHAVSVGETLVAIPLIKELQKSFPPLSIIVTSTTPTGSDRVTTLLGDSVLHSYLPYDIPAFLHRFIRRMNPSLLVIIETELWPNLLSLCRKKQIPVMLANARLSERSKQKYQRGSILTRNMLQALSILAAQSQEDANRFIDLGMLPERIHITGNVKFDQKLPKALKEEARQLRTRIGERCTWIAASTHLGEETLILKAFSDIKKEFPSALLILVPRHPDRAEKVATLCQHYSVIKRSLMQKDFSNFNNECDIILVDTLGELLFFYALADVAFVGGSLVDVGGHNPLEPASLGLPILMGPHLFNFAQVTQLLKAKGGFIEVTNATDLAEQVIILFKDPPLRQTLGHCNLEVLHKNRGSLARQVDLIKSLLS